MQESAEYNVLSRSAFARLLDVLPEALGNQEWTASLEQAKLGGFQSLPPAIVADVDETLLDNSPFQAALALRRSAYDEALWKEWVDKRAADGLPGAKDLAATLAATYPEVRLVYITNRSAAQEEATRVNLRSLGFPLPSDIDTVLCTGEMGWTSDKTSRRLYVAGRYRILALLGDDLGDFVSGAKDSSEKRVALALGHKDMWSKKWFLLPNPLYGSWDGALYDFDTSLSDSDVLARKFSQLVGF